MKNKTWFRLFALVLLFSLPAHAQNEKETFGCAGLFYASPSADLSGGGFTFGGEYVNSKTHWGIGGRVLCGWQGGHEDKSIYLYLNPNNFRHSQCDMIDAVVGVDLYCPARLFDWLTVYAGGGLAFHTLELQFDDFAYTCKADFPKGCTTESLFVGGRWHLNENFHLFGEFRQDFGEVDVVHDYNKEHIKHTYDMDGSRVLIGLGINF